jgi:hypothetical protein
MEQKSLQGKRVPFPKKDMTRNGRWPVTVNISKDHRNSFGDYGALRGVPIGSPLVPFGVLDILVCGSW